MVKVVFDTVVFVRSLINPESWWGKIVFRYHQNYRLIVSRQILQEILEVLQRPEMSSLFQSIEGLDKNQVIKIVSQAEVVELSTVPSVTRDIKDDKFLATAIEAQADYLISADRDLLDLKEYKGIQIIDGETFLKLLKEQK